MTVQAIPIAWRQEMPKAINSPVPIDRHVGNDVESLVISC
jgi:hypothetical protein